MIPYVHAVRPPVGSVRLPGKFFGLRVSLRLRLSLSLRLSANFWAQIFGMRNFLGANFWHAQIFGISIDNFSFIDR